MNSNFKKACLMLFNANELQLELEDDVGVELFFDNLRLHKLNLATSDKENDNKYKKRHLCSKYLRKIINTFKQCEKRIHGNSTSEQHDIQ